MLKVQIAITGQYAENYGVDGWDGEGQCPQYWKQKGGHTELMVCNVDLLDMPEVVKEIKARMQEMSWSNNVSSCHFEMIDVYPNKLSEREFIEWEYRAFRDITSISQEEIRAFLRCFGEEVEEK